MYNCNDCYKQQNIDIRLFNRRIYLSKEEKLKYFKNKKEIAHEERIAEKEEKVKLVHIIIYGRCNFEPYVIKVSI